MIKYEKIYSGLSILGGEPFEHRNIKDAITLCERYKSEFPQKNIWIWSGNTYEQLKEQNGEYGSDVNKLLSLCGTNEKLFIFKCSLLSKNSKNILLSSLTPYFFTILSSCISICQFSSPAAFSFFLLRNAMPANTPAIAKAIKISMQR